MITVPEITKQIVARSRYLSEAMSKGFINNSSLARYIKPEVEQILLREVSTSAIIMALNRLQKDLRPQSKYKNIFKTKPSIELRSNLFEINLANSETLEAKYDQIKNQAKFLVFSKGLSQSTIITSNENYKDLKKVIENEKIISEIHKLSSVTVHLPKDSVSIPGVFYFFLKSLTWEGVNVIEIVSTVSELTLIFEEKDINKAFSILQSLFN